MTGEIPQPERELTPEGQFFNVDAMSDDQIVAMHRGLTAIFESDDPLSSQGDSLLDRLAADVRESASRDPERVKSLVHRCALSHNEFDRELAVDVAPALADFDYGFTRDVLVFLRVDNDRKESRGLASEAAMVTIPKLMRDHLSAEQIEDFNARLAFYGDWLTATPDAPDET